MSWPAVLLIAGALNLVGAAIVAFRLRGVFEHLPFETTLQQIKFDSPAAHAKGNTGNASGRGE